MFEGRVLSQPFFLSYCILPLEILHTIQMPDKTRHIPCPHESCYEYVAAFTVTLHIQIFKETTMSIQPDGCTSKPTDASYVYQGNELMKGYNSTAHIAANILSVASLL